MDNFGQFFDYVLITDYVIYDSIIWDHFTKHLKFVASCSFLEKCMWVTFFYLNAELPTFTYS